MYRLIKCSDYLYNHSSGIRLSILLALQILLLAKTKYLDEAATTLVTSYILVTANDIYTQYRRSAGSENDKINTIYYILSKKLYDLLLLIALIVILGIIVFN